MTGQISETAVRVLSGPTTGLWPRIEAAGFPLALLSEAEGGFGLPPSDALEVLYVAGQMAVAVPLAETMLANLLLARAGLPLLPGPGSFAAGPALRREGGGWRLAGQMRRVPWGRQAQGFALLVTDGAGTCLARIEGDFAGQAGRNLADEPRDDLNLDLWLPDEAVAPTPMSGLAIQACGALMRAFAMAGAMEAALALSVDYANTRQQFGRPIGRFQAVQQSLAAMAGHVAAARAGALMAAAAFPAAGEDATRFTLLSAAAKLRAGEAAGAVSAIAHQVHGAMGITAEHALHRLTLRLWSWREEFGAEAFWADRLGGAVCALPPDGLWPFLTPVEGAA